MQQKVNRVELLLGGETKIVENCQVIKHDEGLYIETEIKIGTDNEGEDLMQKQLILYPWERVLTLTWTDPTLIESVKEAAILEVLDPEGELEGFLEQLVLPSTEIEVPESTEKEEPEVLIEPDSDKEETSSDRRDDPNYNPYG